MEDLLRAAALLCTGAAVLCAALALVATRDLRLAVGVLLDLLLAAGLLRVAVAADALALAGTAAVVLVRHLATAGLREAGAARSRG